jgi:hypothetical protein
MSRASLLILLISAALGLAAGLYIGWVVSPVKYVDTAPASLSQAYKDDYVLMIATLYSENGDLAAARARLAALGFADPGTGVAATAHRFISPPKRSGAGIATQKPEADLRRLARLAAALNATTPEMQPYLSPPANQTPDAP